MRKEITTRNRGDFFVVLFGIVGFFVILWQYRAAAGVDDRLSPQVVVQNWFRGEILEIIFGITDYFYYFCISKQKGINMKQFNFIEYLKNPSRKIVTRDGRSVEIRGTSYSRLPVVAQIEDNTYFNLFSADGKYHRDGRDSQNDLFFATEKS